ncbi:MAG: hypothetical protein GY809_29960 [Planctomycetes bacterium]|nr:hypothetical protein [Planctomycetota bacterium]
MPVVLFIEPAEKKRCGVLHFDKEDGGASAWQHYVDSLPEIATPIAETLGETIKYLDGTRRLGRRARLEMSDKLIACVLAAYESDEWNADGLRRGRLQIRNSVVPESALVVARSWFGKWESKHEAENREVKEVAANKREASLLAELAVLDGED